MQKYIITLGVVLFLAGCGNKNVNTTNAAKDSQTPTAQNQQSIDNTNTTSSTAEEQKINAVKLAETTVALPTENDKGVIELKFKNTNSDEYIRSIAGKKVTITGYISSLSPVDGKFAYLMNLPYQSCPFCVPGTTAVYNTLAIYAAGNNKIEFTDKPVTVEGTLEIGDFTDEFGYKYSVRLINVKVREADVDKLSKNVLIYSAISKEGIISEINNIMYELDSIIYYNFYEQQYNIPASSIKEFDLGRIDTIANKLNSISKTDYTDLIEVLNNARKMLETANSNLATGQIEKNIDLQSSSTEIFKGFGLWLNKYEM